MTQHAEVKALIAHNRNWANKVANCSRGLALWLRKGYTIALLPVIAIAIAWLLGARWNTLMPIVILSIMLATVEMLNTAIERTCDLIDKNWNEEIRRIKNISAGSVLVIGVAILVLWLWVVVDRVLVMLRG